jgi:hypothetical protein
MMVVTVSTPDTSGNRRPAAMDISFVRHPSSFNLCSVQGEYRATNDVDLVADLEHADLDAFLEQLSGDFVTDIDQARSALGSGLRRPKSAAASLR